MKTALVLILLLASFGETIAQSQEMAPGDSIPWELRKQSFIYNTALQFNDPIVARMALYNLIAENPGNVILYDSLALSYLQYNQNASAALSAAQALRINPNDVLALEISATGLDKLGAKSKALDAYEKLYSNNQDISTLYKVGFLQFELKRFAESTTSLDIIIEDPKAKEYTITFPTTDRMGQDVSLEVAAYRVKAMIEESKGNVEEAKTKYLEVLEMFPGFQVVQQQLRELTKPPEQADE
ncbi:MAG: hypothetical protein AAF616_01480 [Bacteroidota bacterium]